MYEIDLTTGLCLLTTTELNSNMNNLNCNGIILSTVVY